MIVDNLPHETFNGKDAQLEAAIQFLKERIEAEPVTVPKPPVYPNKSSLLPPPEVVMGDGIETQPSVDTGVE